MTPHATRIAIIGAGKGGMALLDLLHQIPDVEIVGITDKDPAAPGLQRARDLHVLVEPHVSDLIQNEQVGLIMDVTGDPSMNAMIQAMKRPDAEVLSGAATRLLWKLVQHQSTLEAELFQADKLAGLGSFAAGIAHDINNPLQLILGLAENLVDEQDLAVVHEQARDITEAVKRTSAICRDLTRYARRNGAVEDVMVNLNTKLDEALRIARYAVTLQDVTVVKLVACNFPVVARDGSIYCTHTSWGPGMDDCIDPQNESGFIFRVGPDGTVSVARDRIPTPNGCCFDADERWLYVAQIGRGNIVRLRRRADGSLGEPEPWGPKLGETPAHASARTIIESPIATRTALGHPDGIGFDVEGNLWVTLVLANRIVAITPSERIVPVIEDPQGEQIALPTGLTWGGPRLEDLYIACAARDYVVRAPSPVPGLPLVHQRG